MRVDTTKPWNLDTYRWVGYRCNNCASTAPVIGFRNDTKLCARCMETAMEALAQRSITK